MAKSALIKHVRLAIAAAALAALLVGPSTAQAAGDCKPGGDPYTTQCTYRIPITVGGYEVRQTYDVVPDPDVDGHLTRAAVDLVDDKDGDGTFEPVPIQRLMLHHIVFANVFQQDATCAGKTFKGFDNREFDVPGLVTAPERMFGAGEERAKLSLPDGYGYPMSKNDLWGMVYMVMNHKATTDHAFIQYKVSYVESPNDQGMTDVHPYWLDVRNCRADPIYNVPGTGKPGSARDETWNYKMPQSGRIIAGAGHVHGGARKLTLTEPGCGNRQIAQSLPTWGLPDHPFYNVRPVLHEPGPINMSAFFSDSGIPVKAGETIRLNSLYDNSRPHVRVMGIFVVYVARDDTIAGDCGALPTDTLTVSTAQPGRHHPVPFRIPLTGIDPQTGKAVTITKPPGRNVNLASGASIDVGDRFFSRPNVIVRRGAKLNWRFGGNELHNLTLANGPVAIGSPNLDGNADGSTRDFSHRFSRPGTYRFFCGLHPTRMQERIIVRRR